MTPPRLQSVLSRRRALATSVLAGGAVVTGVRITGEPRTARAHTGDGIPAAVRARLEDAMGEAIAQARMADTYLFGAVLLDVESGATVFRAHNTLVGGDPTSHAEMNAIRGAAAAGLDLKRTFLVTSAESCPMCASAAMWAKLAGVAYGSSIKQLIAYGWGQIDIAHAEVIARTSFWTMPLIGGVLESETNPLYANPPRFG